MLTEDNNKVRENTGNVTRYDNIETTLLATGVPISACVVSLNNGENLANQKSELSNRLLICCTNKLIVWLLV